VLRRTNCARLVHYLMGTIRAAALGLEEEEEKEDFFRVLDVPCWPPEQRTERRLMQCVRQSR
jgi:hypothetical protein